MQRVNSAANAVKKETDMKRNKPSRKFFLTVLCVLWMVCGNSSVLAANERMLAVGGELFGVELDLDGILLSEYAPFPVRGDERSPVQEAGLLPGDLICEVNGVKTDDLSDFTEQLNVSNGAPMSVTVERAGEKKSFVLEACLSDEDHGYHAGFWARESMAGVGTVTYYDPENKSFGGLGHGVCDTNAEALLPIENGGVFSARLQSVVRGAAGAPGELRASFEGEAKGLVRKNTAQGVFGSLDGNERRFTVPAANADEVKEGKAQIVCTVDEGEPRTYDVAISEIKHDGRATKNFIVTVTDEALLEKTGGIVQGMSGSPIIQNGKLVGALTHVLVRHPESGYGIFLENMLAAA